MNKFKTIYTFILLTPLLAACLEQPKPSNDAQCDCTDVDDLRDDVTTLQLGEFDARLETLETELLNTRLETLEALEIDRRLVTLESQVIESDLTLHVPAEYADIQAALASLDGKIIVPTATVTVQLDHGEYFIDAVLTINHPNGERIRIIGDPGSPADVRLLCTTNCLEVSDGRSLGLLQGMTLVGNDASDGVTAKNNGTLTAANLRTEGFSVGYLAVNGGVMFANGTEDQGSIVSYYALQSAALHADGASSLHPGRFGFLAERSAYLSAKNSEVFAAGDSGYAQSYGYIDAELAVATACETGFRSNGPGILNADATQSIDAGSYGFLVTYGGEIVLTSRSGQEARSERSGLVGILVDGPGLVVVGPYTTVTGSGVVDVQALHGGMVWSEGASWGSMDPEYSEDVSDGAYIWR